MNQLMRLRAFVFGILVVATGVAVATGGGCAGVKPSATTGNAGTGLGGFGGSGGPPPINGLESLDVNPKMASITLTANSSGALSGSPAQFMATGSVNGEVKDVTTQVSWFADLKGVQVQNGTATATAPGIYTITAKSGSFMSSATLTVTFQGAIFGPGFDQTNKTSTVTLRSLRAGMWTSNRSPIFKPLTRSSRRSKWIQTSARSISVTSGTPGDTYSPGSILR